MDVWRKGIDAERFRPDFKDAGMRFNMTGGDGGGDVPDGEDKTFLITYIGRLGAEKRIKDIKPVLEALGPNARLSIVGTGPQEDELKEHFAGTKTVFLGQLTGDDLSKAFATGDAFVMPSDSETLGFVVLESMASGVPVVAAKAGGIVDLIDDGVDSFLVEPGNTEAFVARLRELRDTKGLSEKIGAAGRAEAEKWSWEAATSVLRNVQYEKAIYNFSRKKKSVWQRAKLRLWSGAAKVKLLFGGGQGGREKEDQEEKEETTVLS